jgi:hypothetical protein
MGPSQWRRDCAHIRGEGRGRVSELTAKNITRTEKSVDTITQKQPLFPRDSIVFLYKLNCRFSSKFCSASREGTNEWDRRDSEMIAGVLV